MHSALIELPQWTQLSISHEDTQKPLGLKSLCVCILISVLYKGQDTSTKPYKIWALVTLKFLSSIALHGNKDVLNAPPVNEIQI